MDDGVGGIRVSVVGVSVGKHGREDELVAQNRAESRRDASTEAGREGWGRRRKAGRNRLQNTRPGDAMDKKRIWRR